MKTFICAFILCLFVLFGVAFLISPAFAAVTGSFSRASLGGLFAAAACLTAAYGFATLARDPDSGLVSIHVRRHHYKRGVWFRKSSGKPATWAYVGKFLTLNRGYFFNV